MKLFYFSWVLLLMISSCFDQSQNIQPDQIAIVELGNKKLFASDLEKIIHPELSTLDSIAIANAFIDQWIREQLLSIEARKHVSTNFGIEEMVDDYRQKLIKNIFESQIVHQRLDTLVSAAQLNAYYASVKDQHLLTEPLTKVLYAKIPKKLKNSDELSKALTKNDISTAIKIIEAVAIDKITTPTKWYEWSEILLFHKDFDTSKAKQLSLQEKTDQEFKYFLKVIEFVDEKQAAPLSYITSQLKMVIVHQRQQRILDELKQELYEKALETNLIKIL